MMNRTEASFVPSTLMSFAALETDTYLIPNATFLAYPQPPSLVPIGGFPCNLPPVEPEYPMWLPKSEEGAGGYGGMGLNLGHRTYLSLDGRFEGCSRLGLPHPPLCQAEGCNADLWRVKHYHRRHKVCEFHSKATVVVVAGLQQRFCQQCSRFHLLAEFDEAKRSCRRRLAEHNRRRRRRKLQPQPPPTTTSEYLSISSSKNTHANTSEKAKQGQKPSRYSNSGAESLSGAAAADKGSTSNAMRRAEGVAAIDNIVAVAADEEKDWPALAFNSAYLEHHSSSNWSSTDKLFFHLGQGYD